MLKGPLVLLYNNFLLLQVLSHFKQADVSLSFLQCNASHSKQAAVFSFMHILSCRFKLTLFSEIHFFLDPILLIRSPFSFCIKSPCFESINSSVLILFLFGKVFTGSFALRLHIYNPRSFDFSQCTLLTNTTMSRNLRQWLTLMYASQKRTNGKSTSKSLKKRQTLTFARWSFLRRMFQANPHSLEDNKSLSQFPGEPKKDFIGPLLFKSSPIFTQIVLLESNCLKVYWTHLPALI